jgi:hypothetical protein
MNQRGQDVLIEAALAGIPQTVFSHVDGDARCAMGVLIEAWAQVKGRLLEPGIDGNYTPEGNDIEDFTHYYGLDHDQHERIVRANDMGQDFLTIARKLGS